VIPVPLVGFLSVNLQKELLVTWWLKSIDYQLYDKFASSLIIFKNTDKPDKVKFSV